MDIQRLCRGRHSSAVPGLITAGVATLAFMGEAGRWSPTLDVVNSFAPFTAGLAITAALLTALLARRGLVVLALIAAVASGWRVVSELLPAERPVNSEPVVTIVTHNVSVRNLAPVATAHVLLASGADVLLLQETDGSFAPLLRQLRQRYPHATRCPRGDCSLAILSRWPIKNSGYRVRDDQGREIGPPLVRALILPAHRPAFEIVTLHLPWPLPPSRQATIRRELAQVLPRLDRDHLVLAGDFNLTPWSFAMREMDVALRPLTRVTRALASFPARMPSGRVVAWPLLPIDHVFVGHAWIAATVERLPRTGSDHRALRVRLIPRSSASKGEWPLSRRPGTNTDVGCGP